MNEGYTRMFLKSNILAAPVLLTLVTSCFVARAAEPKTCDLMTRQQAAAIAGVAVEAGAEQHVMEGASMCMFSASGPTGQTVSLGVMGKDAFFGATAAAAFKIATTPKRGDTAESIPGLGEAAVLVTSSTESTLNVLFHDRIINVDATGSKNAGLKAALIGAAKTALGKM